MRNRLTGLFLAALLICNIAIISSTAAATKTSADFTDLKDLDAATKAKFDAMISAGIFDGVSDTKFGLQEEMNRAQFAKVASLILGLDVDQNQKTSSFSDVKSDDPANGYALPFIEAVKSAGITDGVSDTEYDPAGKVTKEQLATFLVRMTGQDEDAKTKTITDSTVSDWAKGYVALALESKLLANGEDGKFGGKQNATRDLLLTGAYEAKVQNDFSGKLNVTGAKQVGARKFTLSLSEAADTSKLSVSVTKNGVWVGVQAVPNDDNNGYTLNFPDNVQEGQYTITVSGNEANWNITEATVTAEAEKTTKIEFTYAGDTVPMSNSVSIGFKATNQFGEAVEDVSRFEVRVSGDASGRLDSASQAAIVNTSSMEADDRISVSILDSNAQANKIFKVVAPQVVIPPVIPPVVTPSAATPAANVPNGTAVTAGSSVSLSSATSGATIYYTMDGAMPNAASMAYVGPISITTDVTIKAIAVKSGMTNSGVLTVSYTIMAQVATPTATVPNGTAVTSGSSVSLSSATSGAAIYYTMDGTTPSVASAVYAAPISITTDVTIKAIAVKSGMADSEVLTVSYTVNTQPTTPTASVSSGMIPYGTDVTLSADPGATIRYTTGGATPTNNVMDYSSLTYNSPINVVTSPIVIKAIAFVDDVASEMLTLNYTIDPATIPLSADTLEYEGQEGTNSVLKLTFSEEVQESSAEMIANYTVNAFNPDPFSPSVPTSLDVIRATRGGAGEENVVYLEVDSILGIANGYNIEVVVSGVVSADGQQTIITGPDANVIYVIDL